MAEISGIDLKDSSKENYEIINNLLLEHKVIFFRNQDITNRRANCFSSKLGSTRKSCLCKRI